MQREFKEAILAWKESIGRDEALRRLILEGLSLSIIQKLLGGSYRHHPKGLQLEAIKRAMKEK